MMFDGTFQQATILRTPFGASGLKPCEKQSRNQERCRYDAAVQRTCEKDGERGQNEQGSSCLESVPGTFVRWSFMAEPLSCDEIDPMAGGPSQKIAQTTSISSGEAIHAVIPTQKRKPLFITAFPSANRRSRAASTSSCSQACCRPWRFASSNFNQRFPLRGDRPLWGGSREAKRGKESPKNPVKLRTSEPRRRRGIRTG